MTFWDWAYYKLLFETLPSLALIVVVGVGLIFYLFIKDTIDRIHK